MSSEFALVMLIMVIMVIAIGVMSYVSVRVYPVAGSQQEQLHVGMLLGLAWFVALSLCSVPVLLFVPSNNPDRLLGVAVIEGMALIIAFSMGMVMTRSSRRHQ